MRDFNFKEVNWTNHTTSVGEEHLATLFLETIRDSFFHQHVIQPTRIRQGQEPSVLDLIFTNEENMLDNLQIKPGLGKSDHLVMTFTFNCYIEISETAQKKRNIFKGDFATINNILAVENWNDNFTGLSLTDSWDRFTETLVKLIEKYVPESKG